jgi:hypothetical protein
MPQNETPTREGVSASKGRSAGELIGPEAICSLCTLQVCWELHLVFNGAQISEVCGLVIEMAGDAWLAMALDSVGTLLGVFPTRGDALRAISAAIGREAQLAESAQ